MKQGNKKKIKKLKFFVTLLGIITVFFIVTAIVALKLFIIEKNRIEKESIPSSGLSQSIFDYQNNEYESSVDRYMQYYIANGHYAYDMDESQKADVGNSSFFKVSDNITVGITFCKGQQDLDSLINILGEDTEKAFGMSTLKLYESIDGYRNGFASTYCILNVEHNKNIKMLAYILKIDEGYVIISGFSTSDSYNNIYIQCLRLYDSLHIPEEWERNNIEETSKMFVPESTINNN